MTLTDAAVNSIVGAFFAPDLDLFRVLLDETARQGPGDLAEIGVLLGRSAVLIGDHLDQGETFTVVDLFEDPAADEANSEENRTSYHGVSQRVFEENYLSLHRELPVVVRGLSSTITEKAAHGTHRFVHVDASHLYDWVAEDIMSARTLLRPDGVLALDDFRAEHTPGVAAAAWEAVLNHGLRPILVSPYKMYATWGDERPFQQAVERWLASTDLYHETQSVHGLDVLRVATPQVHPVRRYVPEVAWPLLTRARAVQARLKGESPAGGGSR